MAQGQLIPGDWIDVVPSDTVPVYLIGFRVGGTGDVTAITHKGTTVLFSACYVGEQIIGNFTHIKSTGTTATLIDGAKP